MLRLVTHSLAVALSVIAGICSHFAIKVLDPKDEIVIACGQEGSKPCVSFAMTSGTNRVSANFDLPAGLEGGLTMMERVLEILSGVPSVPGVEPVPVHLVDDQLHEGAGEILILDQAYRWRLESTSAIEYADGTGLFSYQEEILGKPGIKERLDMAVQVIALGVASCEGNERRESKRAADRAMHLAAWVNEVAPTDLTTYTLSLGRFNGECEGSARETSDQRRVVLLAIYERDPDLKINVAMWRELQELSQTGRLRLDPSMYGDFEYAEAL